jgi:HlyD family secretion protein
MKKIVIGVVALCIVVAGVYGLSKLQLSNPFLDGEKEAVKRGDLVIPVNASGAVEPRQFILIKSKAGGQVRKVHVVDGDMVKKGDVLVELDPVDEQRIVEARQANVERAESVRDKAQIAVENAEKDLPLQTKLAEARLESEKARLEDAEFNLEHLKGLPEAVKGKIEVMARQAAFNAATAQVALLETELARARNNETIVLNSAREDLEQAAAALKQATKELDEAIQRRSETTIKAPQAGMVYRVDVKGGEMIQSGSQSFTGGTPLMMLADTSSMFVLAQVDEADIGMIRDIAPEFAKPGKTRNLSNEEAVEYARRVIDADTNKKIVDTSEDVKALSGRPVEVTVDAYRSESFRGVIELILPEPQTLNNVVTFKVRVRLVGEDLEKLLGLQADLAFTTRKIENTVLVKNDALHSEGRDCFVYVPMRDSNTGPWDERKVPVKIGVTDGTFTEILDGLKDGEEVWTKRPRKTDKEKEKQNA